MRRGHLPHDMALICFEIVHTAKVVLVLNHRVVWSTPEAYLFRLFTKDLAASTQRTSLA